jgi:hypothetical protein
MFRLLVAIGRRLLLEAKHRKLPRWVEQFESRFKLTTNKLK